MSNIQQVVRKGCTYQFNPAARGLLLRRRPTDTDFKEFPVPRDIADLKRAVDWFERERNQLVSAKFRASMRRIGLLSDNKNSGGCHVEGA